MRVAQFRAINGINSNSRTRFDLGLPGETLCHSASGRPVASTSQAAPG